MTALPNTSPQGAGALIAAIIIDPRSSRRETRITDSPLAVARRCLVGGGMVSGFRFLLRQRNPDVHIAAH
jgi:hypothetical protein